MTGVPGSLSEVRLSVKYRDSSTTVMTTSTEAAITVGSSHFLFFCQYSLMLSRGEWKIKRVFVPFLSFGCLPMVLYFICNNGSNRRRMFTFRFDGCVVVNCRRA
jgi:hypothetical protein